ncbi:hypothetical protein ACOSQ4_018985 [Xanthoceras sorbifolium]
MLEELRQRAVVRERDARLDELERRVAELSANEDKLKMDHTAEVDNLSGQLSTLMVKCENIADNAVIKTRANIMQEYNKGKVDSWDVDGAIEAWEEEVAAVAAVVDDT